MINVPASVTTAGQDSYKNLEGTGSPVRQDLRGHKVRHGRTTAQSCGEYGSVGGPMILGLEQRCSNSQFQCAVGTTEWHPHKLLRSQIFDSALTMWRPDLQKILSSA